MAGIHSIIPFLAIFIYFSSFFCAKMPTYGYMRTRRELTAREETIMNQNLIDIIQIDDWWLAQNQYSCGEFWRIFEACDQITAVAIDFNENERKQIIHDMIHIKFPFITSLNFSTNNIQSIEPLQFLHAPNLQHLNLTFNNIAEAKTLRKCCFPNLKGLYLHSNYVVQLSWLQMLNCKKLDFLTLQYRDNEDNPVILQNFSILFKINAQTLKKLTWACEKSIKTSAKFAMFAEKYHKIQIERPFE